MQRVHSLMWLAVAKMRMQNQDQYRELTHTVISRLMLVVLSAAILLDASWAAQDQSTPKPTPSSQESSAPASHTHMSEELRSGTKKIVVIAGESPAKQEITGSYEKATPGVLGGISSGSRAGSPSREIGGVTVTFPIPILTVPGAIVGGIAGSTKREIQEFRDALTEDLANASSRRLTNDGLALNVYRNLQGLPELDSSLFASTTPVSDDVDAILYVSIRDVTIDVQGKEAILSTTAELTLRRRSDEEDLYKRLILYQDKDTLANWTRNQNALWHDYANFARHYLGREISAEVFGRVELRHELHPRKSRDLTLIRKNEWQGTSKTTSPTLAWELTLLGGDSYGSWSEDIDESNVYYDVEIYDAHKLVYEQGQVADPLHTIVYPLEACKTYRWSVRPSYRIGNSIKYGEWMRLNSDSEAGKGNVGRKASEAPAYSQEFALLKIKC